MSESEPSAIPPGDIESTDAAVADDAGPDTSDVSSTPKRPLGIKEVFFPMVNVSRVIIFGLFFVAIYMLIQDRLASSRWTEAHEWIKAEISRAGEEGIQRADVASHMLEEYGLYPEEHMTLPTYEYYHWSTMVRVFTIRVQFANTQIIQQHIREVRYNWMEFGEEVSEEAPAGAKNDPGKAPLTPGLSGGGGGRPPGN